MWLPHTRATHAYQLCLPFVIAYLNEFAFCLCSSMIQDTACYAGPVKAPKTKVCCDELTVSPNCPANTVNFTAKPNYLPLSGKDVDQNTCRAATPFPVAPLPPLCKFPLPELLPSRRMASFWRRARFP